MSLRSRLLLVVVAGSALSAAGAPVCAQAAREPAGVPEPARHGVESANTGRTESARTGTWFAAAVGGGWTRVNCAICRTDRYAGPSAALRFGTTLRPGLLIGAEVDGWMRSNDGVRSMLTSGSASAYIYPDPSRGLFLKAGTGLVHYSLDEDSGTNLLGIFLGAGYEFPITPSLSITNSVGLIASSFGSIESEAGTVAEDVSITLFQFGIALTHR